MPNSSSDSSSGIIFAGTPAFAVPSLEQIHQQFGVGAVLTALDAEAGRGRQLRPSPVKVKAEELGIPVLQFDRLGSQSRQELKKFNPQLLVVVAFGKIFGPKFLSLFGRGAVNLHPSLLPKYRGPAPIPATILAGDKVSGITIQEVGLEMDAGAILRQEPFEIEDYDDAGTVHDFCMEEGARLLTETIPLYLDRSIDTREQDHESATYCPKISKQDGEIGWDHSAKEIFNLIRAYSPWPGAFTSYNNKMLQIKKSQILEEIPKSQISAIPGKVLSVDKSLGILIQTGSGILVVSELQLQNKRQMNWKDFLNGNSDFVGSILGG